LYGESDFSAYAYNAVNLILRSAGFQSITSKASVSESLFKEYTNLNSIQNKLSRINEKESRRKKDGVYYTDKDVADFITVNTILYYITKSNKVYPYVDCIKQIQKLSHAMDITSITVFDPTAGTGEFLVSAVEIKLALMKNNLSDDVVLRIISNTFGNDISKESEMYAQLRLFFLTAPYIKSKENLIILAQTLVNNFFNYDFIFSSNKINRTFDILIGNPPYVEYNKLDNRPNNKFGNIYADVLVNATKLMSDNGAMGYIVPLSIVSTNRMLELREFLKEKFTNLVYLNFADRPDCLFTGVHQKLTIVFGSNTTAENSIYSSSYHYWYKSERESLFDNIAIHQVSDIKSAYVPKIGNANAYSIFNKIYARNDDTSLSSFLCNKSEFENQVYLNMRGCFWMKAFPFSPGSNEYKLFNIEETCRDYILCILNSSLFFFYWIAVSDCWHITLKDLQNFKIPKLKSYSVYQKLSSELLNALDETKVYVGTVQTEFEYKHRLCKTYIDKIDFELAKVYHLSENQLKYVQNFALKYRLGDGA
jgi:hypothetical protein